MIHDSNFPIPDYQNSQLRDLKLFADSALERMATMHQAVFKFYEEIKDFHTEVYKIETKARNISETLPEIQRKFRISKKAKKAAR